MKAMDILSFMFNFEAIKLQFQDIKDSQAIIESCDEFIESAKEVHENLEKVHRDIIKLKNDCGNVIEFDTKITLLLIDCPKNISLIINSYLEEKNEFDIGNLFQELPTLLDYLDNYIQYVATIKISNEKFINTPKKHFLINHQKRKTRIPNGLTKTAFEHMKKEIGDELKLKKQETMNSKQVSMIKSFLAKHYPQIIYDTFREYLGKEHGYSKPNRNNK